MQGCGPHQSVRAGWGPSPTGVQTHVAFTDLIRRSEAREAASVTFTNTGSGVRETQSSGSRPPEPQKPGPHSPPRPGQKQPPWPVH